MRIQYYDTNYFNLYIRLELIQFLSISSLTFPWLVVGFTVIVKEEIRTDTKVLYKIYSYIIEYVNSFFDLGIIRDRQR